MLLSARFPAESAANKGLIKKDVHMTETEILNKIFMMIPFQ